MPFSSLFVIHMPVVSGRATLTGKSLMFHEHIISLLLEKIYRTPTTHNHIIGGRVTYYFFCNKLSFHGQYFCSRIRKRQYLFYERIVTILHPSAEIGRAHV